VLEQVAAKQQMEQLSREMDQLSGERVTLDQRLAEAGRLMDLLSTESTVLERREVQAKAKQDADLRLLLDRVIASGAAVPVK
jgi:hypothetical protein